MSTSNPDTAGLGMEIAYEMPLDIYRWFQPSPISTAVFEKKF